MFWLMQDWARGMDALFSWLFHYLNSKVQRMRELLLMQCSCNLLNLLALPCGLLLEFTY